MDELDKFLQSKLTMLNYHYPSGKYLVSKTELKEWINEWISQQVKTDIEHD